MPITQAQMITAVRDMLDEASDGEWTDKNLRRWINDGCRDLCRAAEVLDTVANLDVGNGDATITLPTDLIRISHAAWQEDGQDLVYPLEWRQFNAMDPIWYANREITSSRPQFYTTQGFVPTAVLRLYPIANADGTVQLKYYRLPVKLAEETNADANDNLDIPEGWDEAVKWYVEYMALRKDRDPRWQEAKSLYDEAKGTLIGLSRTLSDQPGMIVPSVTGGGLPGWLVNDGGFGGYGGWA